MSETSSTESTQDTAPVAVLNPVFTERDDSPTPIWETAQFLANLEGGDAQTTKVAEYLATRKGKLDVAVGYRFPRSGLGNRQMDLTETFNGNPRYSPINADETKGLVAKIQTEAKYFHVDIDSMGYDNAKKKFYAIMWCTGCGDYGRRVYTSDMFQVHTCLICSALVKTEK